MDGVIADWELAFIELFDDPKTMSKDELDEKKKFISTIDFYKNLSVIEDGIALMKYCATLGEIQILTSVGKFNSESVAKQKQEWLKKVLGYNIKFNYTQSSEEKARYANSNTILVDDRLKAIVPFMAAGGNAVLYTNYKDTKAIIDQALLIGADVA